MFVPNDLNHFFMPFTSNRAFKADPRMVVAADGMYYTSSDGRKILDATAGLWCVNAGHNNKRIVEAIQKQLEELDYCPPFQFAHPKAFELASRIANLFPADLNHVFFTNSGSEAVDSALKIALAYQRARGKAAKTRLIGRERGYHGVGFGGMSVGGMVANRKYFGTMLAGVDHLPHTHNLKRNAFSRGQPEHGAELADKLEDIITLHDASTIAAVIVEPMAGSTGVLPAPKGYLQRLRDICTKHDILLIFDEVISAFGRLGTATAADYFDVIPDIITCAKGLTNGVVPMGAAVINETIYNAIIDGADASIELFHGYTYSSHPVACAAGLASLETYKEDNLFSRVQKLSPYLEQVVHELRGTEGIIDIRNLGLIGAIELAPREGAPGARGFEAMKEAWNHGVMVRVSGDTLVFSPPFIIEDAQIDEMIEVTRNAILAVQ